MGARTKLNTAYVIGIACVSGFLGLITNSIGAFIICFAIATALLMHDGTIRMKPIRR